MINYRESKTLPRTQLTKLYASVAWSAYTNHIEILEKAIHHSLTVLTAWDHDDLVGLIRVIGDGYTSIYIQDLLVRPDYQNMKIGTSLMTQILNKYPQVRQKVLLTDEEPSVRNFYEKNGFTSADQGNAVAFYKFS